MKMKNEMLKWKSNKSAGFCPVLHVSPCWQIVWSKVSEVRFSWTVQQYSWKRSQTVRFAVGNLVWHSTLKVTDVARHLRQEWSGAKQRVTLQKSDLGDINPDGVNHQNVAVVLSHVVESCASAEAHFNHSEEADGDLGKCESCFLFCH